MKKKELKQIRKLRATTEMLKMAAADVPKRISVGWWGKADWQYQTGMYLRCEVRKGILHVAVFLADYLRMGSRKAAFDLYIDKAEGKFLTYQCETEKWLTAKLDMLPWPSYLPHSEGKWINQKDNELIKSYLGSCRGGYEGLLDYQLMVRSNELSRKHERETDNRDRDLRQTPGLPKDWNRWVFKVGIRENFIFYRYVRKGADHGYCTWCESEVPIRKTRHNRTGRCPVCRHRIVYKALGKFHVVDTRVDNLYLFQRCKDGVMLRVFWAGIRYRSGMVNLPERFCFEKQRLIYDREGRLLRRYYYGFYRQKYNRWIEGEEPSHYYGSYYYYIRDESGPVYGRTMPDLSRHELKNTGLREYLSRQKELDPEKYLSILEKRPELERIAKGGLACLAREYLKSSSKGDLFKKDETALTRMLGINSMELKRLRANNGGFLFLEWLQLEKRTGKILDDGMISWFCSEEIAPDDLRFIRKNMSETQICHYIKRQMRENGMNSSEILTVWRDYLSMAERFGMNVDDSIVYRTGKLRQRHDELVERMEDENMLKRAEELQTEYPQTGQILQELKEIYEYADDVYSITVPSGITDILQEGRSLHHCVGKENIYFDRINRRESYILFLRKAAEPQKPWITLEMEPDGTVRQKSTAYSRQAEERPQIEAFLKKWQKKVTGRLTGKEKKLAENSRELRKKELAELREKQVIIRNGDFGGILAADMLEDDLMEAA